MSDNLSARAAAIVTALANAGLVDPTRSLDAEGVVIRALAQDSSTEQGAKASSRSMLVEIAGYLGGALVFAAFGLFFADRWDDLSDAGQVFALGGISLLLLGAGVLVAVLGGGLFEIRAGHDEVRRRLSSALLTGAAAGAAFTVARQVELMDDSYDSWPGFYGALTLLVLAAAAYSVTPSLVGLVAMAGSAITAVVTGLDLLDAANDSTLWPGISILVLGALWLVGTELGLFVETRSARAIGAALVLFGAQMPLFDGDHNGLAYALTAGAAVVGFVLYLAKVDWPYLALGVLAVTLVIPEAIIDWTDGSLGAGGAVLVAGLTLLGASLTGFRLRKEAAEDAR